jgi:hypothetical protein
MLKKILSDKEIEKKLANAKGTTLAMEGTNTKNKKQDIINNRE